MDVGLEGVLLTRLPSSSYPSEFPYSGEDEFVLAWSDPGVRIAWPSAHPILSGRDRANPLAKALAGTATT